ncbi:MAG: hypothetical protein KDK37_13690 [Leptospiraceae bacterium]|nr:hypothetical protein [Leptospiraceae bacterium]MCB1305333.1 hypothetical protein [Leptospiraceae bacterium]
MKVKNVHERRISGSGESMERIFESLGTRNDCIWPRNWPPMRLKPSKGNLGRGGHGPIRYRVIEHVRGKRIVFEFEQEGLSRGLVGVHYFELLTEGNGEFIIRHVIDVRLRWPAFLLWPILIRPLHDALLEDALDNFESAVSAMPENAKSVHSPYVSLLRMAVGR